MHGETVKLLNMLFNNELLVFFSVLQIKVLSMFCYLLIVVVLNCVVVAIKSTMILIAAQKLQRRQQSALLKWVPEQHLISHLLS